MPNPGGSAFAQSLSSDLGALCAGLDTLGGAFILLDAGDHLIYSTQAVSDLLGIAVSDNPAQTWASLWSRLCPQEIELQPGPQRVLLQRGDDLVPYTAWRRPVSGTGAALVCLENIAADDEREREILRVLHDSQAHADDLFTLYQITQFLNSSLDLDLLCTTLLRELQHITASDGGCIFLMNADGLLQPKVWEGLSGVPPSFRPADIALWIAETWGRDALALPLLADERMVGFIALTNKGISGREFRLLHTIVKELGIALRAVADRQALLREEQKLAAIVTATTDAIIHIGADQRVSDFNPAAERLTGFNANEALALPCAAILGCEAQDVCRETCLFARVQKTREAIPYIEFTLRGRVGERHVAASIAPLPLTAENGPTAVAIVRDMTRQKQIEQMKDVFLATVSHELRTPLALLRGYSDTLLHLDLSPHDRQNYLTGIATTTQHLEYLLQQILDVTRIQEGRLHIERAPVRLVDVVRNVISMLPHSAFRSRIWTEFEPDLPRLYADARRLNQVLLNLVDNALKYSTAKGQVIIRAERDNDRVRVQVMDEGIGINPEDQAVLFTKFQRGHNAQQRQVPGTGLGLFICRSIIEAHDGSITLESTPDVGTTVTFWIPIANEEV